MFVQDGQQYGDEYLAELDYIEVLIVCIMAYVCTGWTAVWR